MEDSSSDTTGDKADTREYGIDFDDMKCLKKKIATLQSELRNANRAGGYRPPSTVLKAVSDIKESVEQIKPVGAYFMVRPADFGYARSLISDDFILQGCERMLEEVMEKIEKLSDEGDVAAGFVYSFVENYDEDAILSHVRCRVSDTINENVYFIYDFGPRVREMMVDILLATAQEEAMPELKKKLNGQ